jgi:hypothetical protein
MLTMNTAREIAEVLANLATFLGIPLAIYVFVRERQRDREERELATYSALKSLYLDYLKLCLDQLELPVQDDTPAITPPLTAAQEQRKLLVFEILVNILEAAFFMYRRHADPFKQAQWSGWNQYMRGWCGREDFQAAWEQHLRAQLDSDFTKHMETLMREVKVRQI